MLLCFWFFIGILWIFMGGWGAGDLSSGVFVPSFFTIAIIALLIIGGSFLAWMGPYTVAFDTKRAIERKTGLQLDVENDAGK